MMTCNQNRKYFGKCAESYRFFLKKFSEKPIFNYESIGDVLSHVYDKMFFRKGPVPWRSKLRLVNTIMLNEQKIRKDLDTLKKHPKSSLEPLESTDVSFGKVTKLVTEILDDCDDYNVYDEEELISKVCEKFRRCSRTGNVETIIRELKKKYVHQKTSNKEASQLQSPIRKRKILLRGKKPVPNPIVLLEKDVRLQEMAKNIHVLEMEQQESMSSEESRNEEYNQNCSNNNLLAEMHTNLKEKETEKISVSQEKSQLSNLLFIKQEEDLIDNSQAALEANQTENECTENHSSNNSQIEVYSQSSQAIENSCATTLLNNQENVLGMRIMEENYNNFSASMQFINNNRFIQNAALMYNSSSNSYMVVPISQFQPNIVMLNSNNMSGYQGILNNPMLFNNPLIQNPMLTTPNFAMMAGQQLVFNQGLNQFQDIARLQNTVENLNSQIHSLGSILANQVNKTE